MANIKLNRNSMLLNGALSAGIIVFVSFYLSYFDECLIDDALISALYASNLSEYAHWGIFQDITTNTATSPLNIILLACFDKISSDMIHAIFLMTTCLMILLWFVVMRMSRLLFGNSLWGWLSFSYILFNPLLMSTIGLEMPLYLFLLFTSLLLFLEKKYYYLAAVLALLTLTRPDGALLFIVILIILPFHLPSKPEEKNNILNKREQILRLNTFNTIAIFLTIYTLCMLPWFLFSWIKLGSFVPETLFIKMNQSWGDLNFLNGWKPYWIHYSIALIFSAIFIPGIILLPFCCKKAIQAKAAIVLFLFALLYSIGYTLLKVPPYHWYYVPAVLTLGGAGTLGVACCLSLRRNSFGWILKTVGGLIVLIPLIGFGFLMYSNQFSLKEAPIHSNWASHNSYKAIGNWLKENIPPDKTILLDGEIGTIAFYSKRRLVDVFSDGSQAKRVIHEKVNQKNLSALGAKINFYWWKAPPQQELNYELFSYPYSKSAENAKDCIMQWRVRSKWIGDHGIIMKLRQRNPNK